MSSTVRPSSSQPIRVTFAVNQVHTRTTAVKIFELLAAEERWSELGRAAEMQQMLRRLKLNVEFAAKQDWFVYTLSSTDDATARTLNSSYSEGLMGYCANRDNTVIQLFEMGGADVDKLVITPGCAQKMVQEFIEESELAALRRENAVLKQETIQTRTGMQLMMSHLEDLNRRLETVVKRNAELEVENKRLRDDYIAIAIAASSPSPVVGKLKVKSSAPLSLLDLTEADNKATTTTARPDVLGASENPTPSSSLRTTEPNHSKVLEH